MTVATIPPPPGSTAERERAAVLPTTTTTHTGCPFCGIAAAHAEMLANITNATNGGSAVHMEPDGTTHSATWHRPTNHIQPHPGGST